MDKYDLEKWIWSDKDFELMGWHDCPIYALKFDNEVSLDLDYIFKWNDPQVQGMPFTFWISPATLIFEDVSLLKANFIMNFVNSLEISEITRSNLKHSTEWIIETREGTITIHAKSFKQIIRLKPSLQYGQFISKNERDNNHFATTSVRDYIESPEILEKRRLEKELYQLAVKRVLLKKELANINTETMSTKEFLLAKKTLSDEINQINKRLYGTRFENY
jgi:hypothetical protein